MQKLKLRLSMLSKAFMGAVAFGFTFSVQAMEPTALFEHESLLHKDYQAVDRAMLQSAPLRYLDDGESEPGYASGGEIAVIGKSARYILDHPPADSSLSIWRHYHKQLSRNGYEVAFQCEANSCGESAGWRLVFGRGVAGDTENQFYLLAHKGKSGEQGSFMAVYVNEIDDQPRSVVHIVNKAELDKIYALPAKTGEQSLYYRLGSSTPSLWGLLALEGVLQGLRQDTASRVKITGYADGPESDYNQALAQRRADYIQEKLQSQIPMADSRVVNLGGDVREKSVNSGQWRRVDMMLLLSQGAVAKNDQQGTNTDG